MKAVLVTAVAAAIETDRRLKGSVIAQAKGAWEQTIHRILTEKLGLVKKFSCWVAQLLSSERKEERVKASQWI